MKHQSSCMAVNTWQTSEQEDKTGENRHVFSQMHHGNSVNGALKLYGELNLDWYLYAE